MKKALSLVAMTLPMAIQAAPVVTQPGALMTLGPLSSPQTGLSVLYNPASSEMVVREDSSLRWGYLGSTGVSVELGAVDDFTDDVDQLIDDLEADNVTVDMADNVIGNYNDNLRQKLGNDGYIKMDTQFVAPLMPLIFRSDLLGGTVSMDLVGGVTLKANILDDDISLNQQSAEFETNTAVYLKSVQYTTLGMGYSRQLDFDFLNSFDGRLIAGTRLNMYNLKLSKQVVGLLNIDDNDDLGDVIADDYDSNQVSTTATGVDLGLIWEAPNYHLGLTLRNINEPEFDYGSVGQDCLNKDTGTATSNCFTAQYFADQGRISRDESHVMTSQATVDVALNTENKRWRLAASYDLQPMRDPVGDEYQWATASAAYVTSYFLGGRIGVSQNQVGSQLTMLNIGATAFGLLSLDFRYGLDTVSLDGSEAPRTFGFNLGLESSF